MTENAPEALYAEALRDFHHARRQAMLEQIVGRLFGRSADLLSYDQVRQKLKVKGRRARELKEIPLHAIIGSVGRYADFTRSFLPKRSIDEYRWAGVKVAATGLVGLPPIEVYQIGEVYFVLDGNHRVSVARQLGATYIEAFVTEFQTSVPLSPDDQPDDLILKADYADFLERTQLGQIRPQADLTVTAPGRYPLLEEHIEVHHYFMGLDQKRDIPYEEAVASWHDTVYLPVVEVIRARGILREFPGRTETDLYVWASKHRAELVERLGWEVGTALAATDLASQASPKLGRVVSRIGERILGAVTSDEPETGNGPGEGWGVQLAARHDERLFAEILVAINGDKTSWQAVVQAIEIARREGSQLRGLHVVSSEEQQESEEARAVRAGFNRRCEEAGIPGELVLAVGKVSHQVCDRSRFTDLVVLPLKHPPPPEPLGKLSSGFRTILRHCAGPVLAVPREASRSSHALLAYDGSPKADEALFVASYLAGRWRIPLTVVSVFEDSHVTEATQARAGEYLSSRDVPATFVQLDGPVAAAILIAAQERQADLIVMGGYGRHPVMEVMLGSVVDEILRTIRQPVLICQ